MWHVSVTLWSRGKRVDLPRVAEQAAVQALAGVGDGGSEWWLWNPAMLVGHLRVPVTDAEYELVPPGAAQDDAGETGPLRARTPAR